MGSDTGVRRARLRAVGHAHARPRGCPERGYASVLSIPRDLRVSVPGHGMQKINAAYSLWADPRSAMQSVDS